jgi:hypothetical protein
VVVLTAYGLYALVAVPWIEPDLTLRAAAAPSQDDLTAARQLTARYHDLLSTIFPPGHWALAGPKVLESPQAMLLLDQWQPLGRNRVQIAPCAALFFPEEPSAASPPGQRAILLEAPQGAVLEFDQPFDPARAKVGKLVRGQLIGAITIRSDMNHGGPDDDLEISTQGVELTPQRIWTDADVRFRLGANHGQGQQLEITLLPASSDQRRKAGGLNVGGIQSLRLKKNVEAVLDLGNMGLAPNSSDSPPDPQNIQDAAAGPPRQARDIQPPLRITCQGPFLFDFVRRVASFTDQVDVLRLREDDASDTLSCQRLSIHFASSMPAKPRAGTQDVTDQSPTSVGSFKPQRIVAEGNPVRVHSPATQSAVRCNRLEYGVPEQADQLPTLHAEGPGQVTTLVGDKPQLPFQATWAHRMDLQYHNGEPVLSLDGQAQLELSGTGRLLCDQFHLYLKPQPRAKASPGSSDVLPNRLVALSHPPDQRHVLIESQPLRGAVGQLKVWFVNREIASPVGQSAPSDDQPNLESRTAPQRLADGAEPEATYDIGARDVSVEIAMSGRQLDVTKLTGEGSVVFREVQPLTPDDEPLVVQGEWAEVDGADRPDTHVTVTGAPAQIMARGVSIRGGNIQLSRGENRLWIDTPGDMWLPMRQDLSGKALAQPQRIGIAWQESMDFDGRTARFHESVTVQTANGWLKTKTLAATLSQPVQFDQSVDAAGIELFSLACDHPVQMESQTLENQAVVSRERMELQNLFVNRESGDILVRGRGWITSVRAGDARLTPAQRTAPDKSTATAAGSSPRLHYLRVDFDRSAEGNLHQRQITFIGQARATYGPVHDWESVIDSESPERLGPDDVLLTSHQIRVEQMEAPDHPRRFIEMAASGNSKFEGHSTFARADRVTYTEAKDLIILEGTARNDAWIFHQTEIGGPVDKFNARKILYWRTDGNLQIDDGKSFNLNHWPRGRNP